MGRPGRAGPHSGGRVVGLPPEVGEHLSQTIPERLLHRKHGKRKGAAPLGSQGSEGNQMPATADDLADALIRMFGRGGRRRFSPRRE